jgi:acyl carrier protein
MKLEELLAGILQVPTAALQDSSGPTTLRAWSSLKHIQLVAALERVYGVKLTAHEMQRLTSLAKVRAMLQQKGVKV